MTRSEELAKLHDKGTILQAAYLYGLGTIPDLYKETEKKLSEMCAEAEGKTGITFDDILKRDTPLTATPTSPPPISPEPPDWAKAILAKVDEIDQRTRVQPTPAPQPAPQPAPAPQGSGQAQAFDPQSLIGKPRSEAETIARTNGFSVSFTENNDNNAQADNVVETVKAAPNNVLVLGIVRWSRLKRGFGNR